MNKNIPAELCAVILTVANDQPQVLIVPPNGSRAKNDVDPADGHSPSRARDCLPFGPFDPSDDLTLERCLRNWVQLQTGYSLGYVEQLYTFADRVRGHAESSEPGRIFSIAYLGLVHNPGDSAPAENWADCYRFLPWEDWRSGSPPILQDILRALDDWAGSAASSSAIRDRRDRIAICFGSSDAGVDTVKVLERYELLYEAGLTAESWFDSGARANTPPEPVFGQSMAFDHRRILATGLSRIRGKIRYRPLVFELIAAEFTLMQLQKVVESLAGFSLHTQNFRRLVEQSGLVESTGGVFADTGGRPAALFKFRQDVIRERRAPGISVASSVRSTHKK